MKHLLYLLTTLFLVQFITGCESDENTEIRKGQAVFSISFKGKSGGRINTENPNTVIVTIKGTDGEEAYTHERIELLSFGDSFISEPISLLVGDFELTEFLVLNDNDEVIYATPVEGSDRAHLVKNPLPIDINITEDEVSKVTPEVISTDEAIPEDFGYVSFGFETVDIFDFLVAVMIYDNEASNFVLTSAKLIVEGGDDFIYDLDLEDITNQVTVRDGYDSYTLTIIKDGYQSYQASFSNADLKSYFENSTNGPLIITLEEQTQFTLTLQPSNGKDAMVCNSHIWSNGTSPMNTNYADHGNLRIEGWTANAHGAPQHDWRSLIEFEGVKELSNVEIESATLTLYADPLFPHGLGGQYGDNQTNIYRITESWEEDIVTWNNQPSYDNSQFAHIPTNNDFDFIAVDVTELIKATVNDKNGSFGFLLKLVNEDPYRSMDLASSDYDDPLRHPKLEIQYTQN